MHGTTIKKKQFMLRQIPEQQISQEESTISKF
jgi:hypothetical protein